MAFDSSIVGETRLPVYAIQGDKDEQFAIEPVRAAVAALQAEGADVTLTTGRATSTVESTWLIRGSVRTSSTVTAGMATPSRFLLVPEALHVQPAQSGCSLKYSQIRQR